MKKVLVVLMGMFLVATAGIAYAAQSTVSVNANVVGKCIVDSGFDASGMTINLPDLDPSLTTGVVSQTTTYAAALRCTKGFTATTAVVASDDFLTDGTDNIPYTAATEYQNGGIATTTGLGFSMANALDLVVTATVTNGTFADVAAGAYSDTFTIDITP